MRLLGMELLSMRLLDRDTPRTSWAYHGRLATPPGLSKHPCLNSPPPLVRICQMCPASGFTMLNGCLGAAAGHLLPHALPPLPS